MTDNTQLNSPQDRSRINIHQEHELRYWSEKFGVSDDELRQAVARVGVSADAVADELGRA